MNEDLQVIHDLSNMTMRGYVKVDRVYNGNLTVSIVSMQFMNEVLIACHFRQTPGLLT